MAAASRAALGTPNTELRQFPQTQVLFNHRSGGRYRSPLSSNWLDGDDLEQAPLEPIDSSKQSLQLAVQELALPRIATALIRAHQCGVAVQIVLENNYSAP